MKDEHEGQGKWWLPEHEDHQVPGWFTWDSEEAGQLRLVGRLKPIEWEDHELPDGTVQRVRRGRAEAMKNRGYPLIHGKAGGKAYTLLDSSSALIRENLFHPDEASEIIHVDRFLVSAGGWFTNTEDDLAFDGLWADLRHLTAWVGHTGLRETLALGLKADREFASISASKLPKFELVQGTSGSVNLTQWMQLSGDGLHSKSIEQEWHLQVQKPETRPLNELVETASDVQDLVSIASGANADFKELKLEHPDFISSRSEEEKRTRRTPISYYARWTCPPDKRRVRPHDLFFTFEDFGGAEGLGRWLKVAEKYRTELGRVMATRYGRSMYLEDRVMNICAALDSFDTVRRNTGIEVHYVTRIKQCTALAGAPFEMIIAQPPDEWAKEVKELRHDIAHHRDRFRLASPGVGLSMSDQLFWLFVLCLFRLSDTPDSTYESWSKHREIEWLASQAASDST